MNQQLTDSQRVNVPCIPLISPSLAVGLAVDARLLVHTLLQATDGPSTVHRHDWIVRNWPGEIRTPGPLVRSLDLGIMSAELGRQVSVVSITNRVAPVAIGTTKHNKAAVSHANDKSQPD